MLAVGLTVAAGYWSDLTPNPQHAALRNEIGTLSTEPQPPASARPAAPLVTPSRPTEMVAAPAPTLPLFTKAEIVLADPPRGNSSSLTHTLLAELRRTGCYEGPALESWTPAAQSAMHRALALTNAQLPVDRVDPSLLALVQTMPNEACHCAEAAAKGGKACPLVAPAPKPAIARAPSRANEKKVAATTGTWTTTVAAAPVLATRPAPVRPSLPVTGALPDEAPAAATSAAVANDDGYRAHDPLPGRMALSGPNEGPAPQPGPVATVPQKAREVAARAVHPEPQSRPQQQVWTSPVRTRSADTLFRHPLGN